MDWRIPLVAAGALLAGPAFAAQTVIPNYDSARDSYFWPLRYHIGGKTV